jgi:hypothetical protein
VGGQRSNQGRISAEVSILKFYPSPIIAILPKESDKVGDGCGDGRAGIKKILFSYLMLEFRSGNRVDRVGLIF